jgi:nitrogen fixation/metabolism regulation signal transduction histidine kinase
MFDANRTAHPACLGYVADRQAALDASSADVTRVVLGVALTLALGAVVATATAAVTAWKTSRAILFPLSGLVTATRALQSGRSDLPLPPSSADEIGELGRAFGEMRRVVAEREAALASERARAESILRSLAEGLCLLDDELQIVYVNPSLGALVGRLDGAGHGEPGGPAARASDRRQRPRADRERTPAGIRTVLPGGPI